MSGIRNRPQNATALLRAWGRGDRAAFDELVPLGDLTLDAEHVWIAKASRAILLDFRCPGLPARGSTSIEQPAQAWTAHEKEVFVRRFATAALRSENVDSRGQGTSSTAVAGRLPLHAHAFLRQLDHGQFPSLNAIAAALGETLGRRAVLTRGRRAVHLTLSAAVPTCFLVAGIW